MAETVIQKVLFGSPSDDSQTSALFDGAPCCPLSFAIAPNGYVYMAHGRGPMMKWDGLSNQAFTAGVEPPSTPLVLTASIAAGTMNGTYQAYVRFVDRDGNISAASPISNSITLVNKSFLIFGSVPQPTDPKVTRRQILRHTNGNTTVFYIEIDTQDISSTSFTTNLSDTLLQARLKVDPPELVGVQAPAVPSPHKPFVVLYQDRLFAAGEAPLSQGHLSVTFGSTAATGVGVTFPDHLAGQLLYIQGHNRTYQIDTTLDGSATLPLTETYKGQTDPFALYEIRQQPSARLTVNFSAIDTTGGAKYDSWPQENGLTIEANGDEITGLAVAHSFLYIFQRRHTYRLTYGTNPLTDGSVFLAARRGCINNRCWVYIEDTLYALDEKGVYAFSRGEGVVELSTPIQNVFWPHDPFVFRRINWNTGKCCNLFHAHHFQPEGVIRWFVTLDSEVFPRHAICLHYSSKRWWLEEYPFPIAASTSLREPEFPALGGAAGRIYSFKDSSLDCVTAKEDETTRGTVTSATFDSLTDALATFPSSLAGKPLSIVSGRGAGQQRIIASQSSTTLRVDWPWLIVPDSTSVYQLGGVPWNYRSGWQRWGNMDGKQMPRRIEVIFRPAAEPATVSMRLYLDNRTTPEINARDWPPSLTEADGLTMVKDGTDMLIDLTRAVGYVQIPLEGGADNRIGRGDFVQFELDGVSADDEIGIHGVRMEGAQP